MAKFFTSTRKSQLDTLSFFNPCSSKLKNIFVLYLTISQVLWNTDMITTATPLWPAGHEETRTHCCVTCSLAAGRRVHKHDSGWAWLVAVCGCLCNVFTLGCSYSFGVIYPSLLDEFKRGKAQTGNRLKPKFFALLSIAWRNRCRGRVYVLIWIRKYPKFLSNSEERNVGLETKSGDFNPQSIEVITE